MSENIILESTIDKENSPLCACGICGEHVTRSKKHKGWNKYIKGHQNRTEINRKKLSQMTKQRYENPLEREKTSLAGKKANKDDPNLRIKRSLILKKTYENPEIRNKISESVRRAFQTPEKRQIKSNASKRNWQNSEYRNKMTNKIREFCRSLENREKISKFMREKWQETEFISKILLALGKSPNIPESLLFTLTPDQVEYVGNGKFWRTLKLKLEDGRIVTKHKNPDFLINGKKKVIEFNGDFFHKNDYPDEVYQQAWADIGYQLLIIHENELKNIENVLDRIAKFIGQETWQMTLL